MLSRITVTEEKRHSTDKDHIPWINQNIRLALFIET